VTTRPVTLEDVAHLAEVSKSTVSRILHAPLNERAPFDPRTRERVLRAVEALGYVPSRLAQGLSQARRRGQAESTRARTGIIGLTVPSIEDSFFPAVTSGIERRLAESGCNLILATSSGKPGAEAAKVEGLLAWHVDGLIAAPCQETTDPALFWDLWRRGVRFVLIDRAFPDTPFASVTTDDRVGAALAVEHLLATGRERIARAGGPLTVYTNRLRHEGFSEALVRGGRIPDPRLAIEIAPSVEGGRRAIARLMELEERPDALFCFSDLVGMGALEACLERGIRVPQDLALVGYADLDASRMLRVPLTTIRQPKELLGRTAADLLLALLDGTPPEEARRVLPVELVVRDSTNPQQSSAQQPDEEEPPPTDPAPQERERR
jgi:LacI family transcriptional regulator